MSHLRDPNKPNAQHGFTLVELMISIAIMGVLTTLAVPTIKEALAKQRKESAGNTLFTALRSAKSESLLRRKDFSVQINDGSKEIMVLDQTHNPIATYNYHAAVSITSTPATGATFTTQKSATPITYKVCYEDNNQGIQIQVSSIANLTATGVSCP